MDDRKQVAMKVMDMIAYAEGSLNSPSCETTSGHSKQESARKVLVNMLIPAFKVSVSERRISTRGGMESLVRDWNRTWLCFVRFYFDHDSKKVEVNKYSFINAVRPLEAELLKEAVAVYYTKRCNPSKK